MNVTAGLMDLGNVYLQRRGDPGGGGGGGGSPSTHLGSRITAAGWNLFTQLWGSAGPGEGEDVFRASLIMAAWEEINRAGPAGMLQLLPPAGGGGAWSGRGHGGPAHRGGYATTLAVWSTSAPLRGLVNPHTRSGRMQTEHPEQVHEPGAVSPPSAHV